MYILAIKHSFVITLRKHLVQLLRLHILTLFTAMATSASDYPGDSIEADVESHSAVTGGGIESERKLGQSKLIYKSFDAVGHVSFGDQPSTNAVEFEALERPSYQQNTSTEELQTRLDQMAATTKRLQEDRKLRSKLRHDEAEARKSPYQAPVVVVENRVYRPRTYPYLYKPHHYKSEKNSVSQHSGSSLGIHLGGGSSKFHYGLSYGSHQRQREVKSVQIPYSREQGHIRSSGLIKRRP